MSGVHFEPSSPPLHVAAASMANTSKVSGGGIPEDATSGRKLANRSPAQKGRVAERKVVRGSTRFNGFAQERSGNTAKWYASVIKVSYYYSLFRHCRYVDGRDFMWAISELM